MGSLPGFFLSLALPLAPSGAQSPPITLASSRPGDPPAVEVVLPKEAVAKLKAANPTAKEWPDILRVVVAGGTAEEERTRTPLAGTHTLTETGIRFEPQFPLVPGREYRAVLRLDAAAKPVAATLFLPKPPPGPRVAVAAVYPSGNRLPENTLRFYIHFSGEIARGDVYRRLRLVRDDGVEVKEPLLELDEELWSPDGTRLTVFLHPGRVKRNLVPREELGPILEEGRTYTLSIPDELLDTEGRPLAAGFKKTFTAGPPDDEPVDPDRWALTVPQGGSDSPLVIRLAKPLDHALLGHRVWVTDAAGSRVPGEVTVGGGERVVTFAPDKPWARGDYKLVVDTRLEDVCGNRVGEPFEVDEFRPVTRKIETKTVERPFRVR
jgi:hypothetical protein